MDKNVSFVGAGRVGTSLARLLFIQGYQIDALICRSLEHAVEATRFVGSGTPACTPTDIGASSVIFLTVPDDYIALVCTELAEQGLLHQQQTVVHCSGVLGVDALVTAQNKGAAVLSMHPLQSVSSPASGVELLPSSVFALEGCDQGLLLGKQLVQALGGYPLMLASGRKAAYHTAAVMASNYVVALLDMALKLMRTAGVSQADALMALTILAEGTLTNIRKQGIPNALTGPIERGDVSTVQKHLAACEGEDELRSAYALLGLHALALAQEKHTEPQPKYDELVRLLHNGFNHER